MAAFSDFVCDKGDVMNDELSGWHDWQSAFEHWGDVSVSELHGLMTAVMVACEPADEATWAVLLEELSFSMPDQPALKLLSEYATDVSFMLKDQDDAYEYEPLVPDDEHDLSERFLALKDWAGGFITGIGVADLLLGSDEREQLADLAKIAGIRPDENGAFDGDEESYWYLFEFVRMVPVSLYRKKRKAIKELALIKGLSPERLTAKESQKLPLVIDAMPKQ